jgi:hypothetical protein
MPRSRPARKSFPSYEKLLETTSKVCDLLACHVAIVGGLAMQTWGSDRLTKDVDLIVARVPPDVAHSKPLVFGGVAIIVDGIDVDLIDRDDDYAGLYAEALDNAEEFDDLPAPVVAPEYLVAMKMVAGRPKDDLDVNYLLSDPDLALNFKQTEGIVREHLGKQAVRDLRDLRDTAQWLKSRGKL